MSRQLQNPAYQGKALEQQWINNIFSSHDLMCGCRDPILHLLILLNKQGKAIKPETEVRNIKCLITGEKDSEDNDMADIDQGDLEALFADDGPGDDPTTEDTG